MPDRSYALNIVADISRYQKEFAKIEGFTDKKAAAAANKLVNQMQRAQTKAADAAKKAAAKGTDAWGKSFDTMRLNTSSLTGMLSSAASMAGPVGAIGIAAVGAATGIFKLADSTSAYIDSINIAASRTGLTTTEVIALTRAAEDAGASFDDIKPGLGTFVKMMNDSTRGLATAEEGFANLGVEVTNSDGSLRDASDVLGEVLGGIGKLGSATEKTAAAQMVFGSRGAQVVGVLGESSTALASATEATQALAKAVAEGQDESRQMDEAMAALSTTTTTLKTEIGVGLIPAVAGFVDVSTKAVNVLHDVWDAFTPIRDVTRWIDPWYLGGQAVDFFSRATGDAADEMDDATGPALGLTDAMGDLGETAEATAASLAAVKEAAKVGDAFSAMGVDLLKMQSGLTDAQMALTDQVESRRQATKAYIEEATKEGGITIEQNANIWSMFYAWEAAFQAKSKVVKVTKKGVDAIKEEADALEKLRDVTKDATAFQLSDQEQVQVALIERLDLIDEQATKTGDLQAVEAARAAAFLDANRQIAEIEQENAANAADLAAASREMVTSQTDHRLSAMAAINEAEREALESHAEITKERLELFTDDIAARDEISEESESQRADIAKEFGKQRIETEKEVAASAAAQQKEMVETTLTAFSAMAAQISATELVGEGQLEASGNAARLLFGLSKMAAIAEITFNLASGLMAAGAMPPPASYVYGAQVSLAFAAAMATTATAKVPTFGDTPGAIRAGPGGSMMAVAASDFVIAAQSEKEALRQASNLAGNRGAGGNIVPVETYQLFNRFAIDMVRQPGPVRDALRRAEGRRGARGF